MPGKQVLSKELKGWTAVSSVFTQHKGAPCLFPEHLPFRIPMRSAFWILTRLTTPTVFFLFLQTHTPCFLREGSLISPEHLQSSLLQTPNVIRISSWLSQVTKAIPTSFLHRIKLCNLTPGVQHELTPPSSTVLISPSQFLTCTMSSSIRSA